MEEKKEEEICLLDIINREITDYQSKRIQVVPGFDFNQRDTIEKVYRYYNSKYENGEIDEDGDKKYFYNIVRNPCKVYSKAIDFDTKNIRLLTVGGGNPLKTWFMERDLRYWMRDKQFGKVLNRIFLELPIYGSVVLKVVDGYVQFVDLRNFIVEQCADMLDTSNYIIEIHSFTPAEFRRAAEKMGWNKVDETLGEFRKMEGATHIKVYERYGELKVDKDYKFMRSFIADVGVDELNTHTKEINQHKGVILKEDEIKELPYWEYHLEKISGRWLGVGVVETLFEPQIRENELCNLQSKASYWRSIVLFQSPDPAMGGKNLLGEKRNGDVLDSSNGNTTQVDISDRNLAYFNDEYTKWLKNRDELSFSYDVVQGERLPAGTPLGSAQIATAQTLSYFEQIQENIAMDIKEMIYSVIIPQFEKEISIEHTLRLVGKDLDAYVSMIIDEETNKEIIKIATKPTGKIPTSYERDVIKITIENGLKQKGEILKKLPKNFYKDIKYDVDIDITGESVDTRVRSATKFSLMQFIQSDPTALQDPNKRNFLFSIAEDNGIDLYSLIGVQKQSVEQQMAGALGSQGKVGGGGVSAPVMTQGAIQGNNTKTI